MLVKEFQNKLFLRFDHNEDFVDSLSKFLEEKKISSAVIISGVGMLCDFEIGWFNIETKEYETRRDPIPHELISVSGNVSKKDGKPFAHLHVALASQTHRLFGGHLFKGIVCNTVELVIEKTPEFDLKRGEGKTFRPIV